MFQIGAWLFHKVAQLACRLRLLAASWRGRLGRCAVLGGLEQQLGDVDHLHLLLALDI